MAKNNTQAFTKAHARNALKDLVSDSGSIFSRLADDADQNKGAELTTELQLLRHSSLSDQVAAWWRISTPAENNDALGRLLAACPDLIFGYLEKRKSKGKLQRPGTHRSFHTEHLTTDIERVWMGHGLSPTGDSIALLADMGRVQRVSYALNAKRTQVALAGSMWAGYSLAALRSGANLPQLRKVENARKKLYLRFGFQKDDISIWDLGRTETEGTIDIEEVENHVESAIELSERLSPDQLRDLLRWSELSADTEDDDFDCTIYDHQLIAFGRAAARRIANAIGRELRDDVIAVDGAQEYLQESVQSSLGKEDAREALRKAMTYLVCQIKMQESRIGSVKIGPETERSFDRPFNRIMAYKSDSRLISLYLPHYMLGTRRVLPYTALSVDVSKERNWQAAQSELIMLSHNHDNDYEHICSVLSATPIFHRARLIADLVSFLAFCVPAEPQKELLAELDGGGQPYLRSALEFLIADPKVETSKQATEFVKSGAYVPDPPAWAIPFLWQPAHWAEAIPAFARIIVRLAQLAN